MLPRPRGAWQARRGKTAIGTAWIRAAALLAPHARGWQVDFPEGPQVQWQDRWLKGVDDGADRAPRVILDVELDVEGVDRWHTEADRPIPDAKPAVLRLGPARSGTIDSLNDGTLEGFAAVAAAALPPPSCPARPAPGRRCRSCSAPRPAAARPTCGATRRRR